MHFNVGVCTFLLFSLLSWFKEVILILLLLVAGVGSLLEARGYVLGMNEN